VTTPEHRVLRLGPEEAWLALEAVRTVKRPAAGPDLGVDGIRQFLSRPSNVLIVAVEADQPIGFLLAYLLDRVDRDQPMACLYEIDVLESHRRQGAGRAMVDALKAVCTQAAATKIWAITHRSNAAAVGLYRTTGAVAAPEGDDVVFVYD
jgi:ribosomal protein S18 acetylase RimI-like enzyme